jgi:hypothetical protein
MNTDRVEAPDRRMRGGSAGLPADVRIGIHCNGYGGRRLTRRPSLILEACEALTCTGRPSWPTRITGIAVVLHDLF